MSLGQPHHLIGIVTPKQQTRRVTIIITRMAGEEKNFALFYRRKGKRWPLTPPPSLLLRWLDWKAVGGRVKLTRRMRRRFLCG